MTCLDSQKAGGNKTHFIDKLSHKLKPTSIGLDAIHISKSLQKNDKQVLSFVDFPHQRNSTMLLEKKNTCIQETASWRDSTKASPQSSNF